MQHGAALARESGDAALAEAVASGDFDGLGARLAALCRYAVRLTRDPAAVREDDLAPLREEGLDDRGIVDANQVVSYFNYVNRVADGLGVQLEDEWPEELRRERRYPLADPFPVAGAVPWLTVDQMREVDRIMVDELGVSLVQMVENAGRNLALLARALLGGDARGRRVAVLAGSGGNGGGGLAAARHLVAAGASVSVCLATAADRLRPVTRLQYDALDRLGAARSPEPADAELVLDALLGYGQAGPPSGRVAELVASTRGRRVLALDVPSGLELATGIVHQPAVQAEATLTLALPKQGLGAPGAAAAVGTLYLADISVPPVTYQRLGLDYESPFGASPVVRLRARAASPEREPRRV